MQAMATGLPIVASDVNGVSNMLREGCGALYPSQDVEALAGQMSRWIDAPSEAAAFAQRALHRAETEYAVESVVNRYETLIVDDLARWSSSVTVP